MDASVEHTEPHATATGVAAMDTENPVAISTAADASAAPEVHNPLLDEYSKLLKTVAEKPEDFSSWTSLLATAEKLDDITYIRSAYDAFFVEYPLCYGYWKKYAEAERRHGSVETAIAVYERGVAATPYSTDLWVSYGAFLLATDAATDAVRSVHERGLQYVGADWLSHSLWDKAIEFEGSHGSPASVASLYSRALLCPIKELDKYHDGLVSYAASRTAHELLSEDAAAAVRNILDQQAAEKQAAAAEKQAQAEAAAAAAAAAATTVPAAAGAVDGDATATNAEAAPGIEAEQETVADAADAAPGEQAAADAAKPTEGGDTEMTDATAAAAAAAPVEAVQPDAAGDVAVAATEGSEQAQAAAVAAAEAAAAAQAEAAAAAEAATSDEAMKALWLQQQEAVYAATKQQQEARRSFETAIKRPYWHIKPLDAAQLKNWVAYLDWQEGQGDVGGCVRLYERCCVPCANYPEFWQRYVLWCEAKQPDAAAAVLTRAVTIHCKRRPDFLVFAARFHEAHDDMVAARELYRRVLSDVSPGLLEVVLAAANFERRVGDAAAAAAVFDQLLEQEQAKSNSSIAGFISLMYANYLRQAYSDVDRARQVLQQGLESSPDCQALWEGAAFFEETIPGDDRVQRVLAVYDKALDMKQSSSRSCNAVEQEVADGGAAANGSSADGTGAVQGGQEDTAVAGAAAGNKKQLNDAALEELSKKCVEFADMYADIGTVRTVQQRHRRLFMLPAAALAAAAAAPKAGTTSAATDAGKKRAAADDNSTAMANGPVAKAARTADASAAHDQNAAAAAAAAAYYPPPPTAAGYGAYGMLPPYGYGHPSYPPPYGYGYDSRGYGDRGYGDRYGGY